MKRQVSGVEVERVQRQSSLLHTWRSREGRRRPLLFLQGMDPQQTLCPATQSKRNIKSMSTFSHLIFVESKNNISIAQTCKQFRSISIAVLFGQNWCKTYLAIFSLQSRSRTHSSCSLPEDQNRGRLFY